MKFYLEVEAKHAHGSQATRGSVLRRLIGRLSGERAINAASSYTVTATEWTDPWESFTRTEWQAIRRAIREVTEDEQPHADWKMAETQALRRAARKMGVAE